jgi:hypothetical protein
MALFQRLNYEIIKVVTIKIIIIIYVILIIDPFLSNDGTKKPSLKKWKRKILKITGYNKRLKWMDNTK